MHVNTYFQIKAHSRCAVVGLRLKSVDVHT